MNSGTFVMLIIRPAQSQCGRRTYEVTTKTLDHVGSLETAPRPSGYATIIPIYGQFLYDPELSRNTRVNLCLRREMWLSADGRSENRTKIQILGFHSSAASQQAVS